MLCKVMLFTIISMETIEMVFSNSLIIHQVETIENHDRDGVLISITFLRFFFSISFFVLVSIKKWYKTIVAVFDHIFKYFKVKNTPQRVLLF